MTKRSYLDFLENIEEEEDQLGEEIIIICSSVAALESVALERSSPLLQIRWRSAYLLQLAVAEGSFVVEYRVDPRGFDILHALLERDLEVNQENFQLMLDFEKEMLPHEEFDRQHRL